MKKLMLTAINRLELVDAPIPAAGPESAVVRVKYAGICGSDLHIMAGEHPTARPPFVMGHEVCGEIAAICSDRRHDLRVGDKVAVHAVLGCGACDACRAGRENLCEHIEIMGAGRDGFYSDYVCCPADRLMAFRPDVDLRIAALAEPLTIAVHDVRRSGLQAGEDVLVSGAGTIGILIGLVARLTGAARVVVTDIDPHRLRRAAEFGLTAVDARAGDPDAAYQAAAGLTRFDKVFEVTGAQSSFDRCLAALRRGGTMVQVGMPVGGCFEHFRVNDIIFNEAAYIGVRNSSSRSMAAAVKLINDGLLDDSLRRVVSAIYPKTEALAAFEAARRDKALLKVLIDFG